MVNAPHQDWRVTLKNFACNKIQNDLSSRNSIDCMANAILQDLGAGGCPSLSPQEITNLIGCVRTVLQLWSKGAQSPCNEWSRASISVTSALALALSCPDTSLEPLSKSFKLIGFCLVRSPNMGEGDALTQLLGASCALVASLPDSTLAEMNDPALDKMLQYFAQSVADLCGKIARNPVFEVTTGLIRQLGEGSSECVLRAPVLARIEATTPDETNRKKLILYLFEAVFMWTLAAVGKDIQFDIISGIRQQLFGALRSHPCPAVVSRMVELSTRNLSTLIKKAGNENHGQDLYNHMNTLIAHLSEQWSSGVDNFLTEDGSRDCLQLAMKLLLWQQETSRAIPSSTGISPEEGVRLLCTKHLAGSSSSAVTSWRLLVDIISVHSPQDRKSDISVGASYHSVSSLIAQTEVSDLDRDLLGMLFQVLINGDRRKRRVSAAGENVVFDSVELFSEVFCGVESDSCLRRDVDGFSFKVLLNGLKQLSGAASGPLQDPQCVAMDLQFCALSMCHVSRHLSWDCLTGNTSVSSSLKQLCNLLLKSAAATSLLSDDSALVEPSRCALFSAGLAFFRSLSALFCSNGQDATAMPALFSTLGEAASIIVHSFFKLGLRDFYNLEVLQLMDIALVVFDIINVDSYEKQDFAKMFTDYVLNFSVERTIPPEYIATKSFNVQEWSSDVAKESEYLRHTPPCQFLQTSCRHEALDCFMRVVAGEAKDMMVRCTGEDRQELVERIVEGSRVVVGKGVSDCKHDLNSSTVVQLSVISLFLWSNETSPEGMACGQFDSGTMIDKLKNILLQTADHREALQTKFKVSILLLQWTFSANTQNNRIADNGGGSDVSSASSGGSDISSASNIPSCQVVSVAFMIWQKLIEVTSTDDTAAAIYVDFFENTYQLFFFLGMFGKVDEQIQLLLMLWEKVGTNTGDNKHLFAEVGRYSDLLSSLKSYMTLWLTYNGLHSKVTQLDTIKSTDTEWSLAISSYITQSLDILHVSNNPKSVSVSLTEGGDLCTKWTKTAEDTFKMCRSGDLPVLASQLALLHSKLVLIATGEHEAAVKWAKYGISVLKPDSTTASEVITSADTTPLEMEGMLLIADLHEMTGSLDRCVSYLAEAKALSICSASSTLKCLYALHAFRIYFRLNAKLFANELNALTACFDDLHNTSGDSFCVSLEQSFLIKSGKKGRGGQNFVFDALTEAVSYITRKLCGVSSDFSNFNSQASKSALSFRFLKNVWVFSESAAVAMVEKGTKSPHETFVQLQRSFCCTLSDNMRGYLQTALASIPARSLTLSSSATFSGLSRTGSIGKFRKHIQTQVNGKPAARSSSFDILRSLRRRFCVDCLSGVTASSGAGPAAEGGSIGDNAWQSAYAFALGAASCGTSVESSLENKSDMAKDRSSKLSAACAMVDGLCLGDEEKLREVMSLLEFMGAPGEGGQTNKPIVTCFVTLEHSSQQLIIGRKDATVTCPFVVAVPGYDAIVACLEEWEEILAMNGSQLARTADFSSTKSWSNEAKAQWWEDRDALDARIEAYLGRVQAALGVWRCLLAPKCSFGSDFSMKVDADIRSSLISFLNVTDSRTAHGIDGRSKKGARKTVKNPITSKEGSAFSQMTALMIWIHFVTESEVISSDEQIEGIYQLLSSFLHERGGGMGGEVEIKEQASELWEIAFSGREKEKEVGSTGGGCQSSPASTVRDSSDSGGGCGEKFCEEVERKRLTACRVPELRQMLKDNEQETSGKKSELVDRLCVFLAEQQEEKDTVINGPVDITSSASTVIPCGRKGGSHHVVLILDERLQVIPMENMPMLRGKEASRVPGLSVLVNLMLLHTSLPDTDTDTEAQSSKGSRKRAATSTVTDVTTAVMSSNDHPFTKAPLLKLSNCWYCIDPEDNLSGTRATMTRFMQPFAEKWGWEGVVGEKPPASSIKSFHESADLFVYCGHGSGDRLFERQNRLRKLRCPAAMLWGCSSGALTSSGVHDPSGTCLSYLLGGAPFVIGNLWDVTDRDIDKLSVQCMSSIFEVKVDVDVDMEVKIKGRTQKRGPERSSNRNTRNGGGGAGVEAGAVSVSVSSSLSWSRGACKLKAAVGYAPVMYGLPVVVDNTR